MTESKNKPPKQLPLGFRLEAERSRKGLSITVCGVVSIVDLSCETVILKTHGGKISFVGKRLSVKVFEHSTVEISGKVEDIRFDFGKN